MDITAEYIQNEYDELKNLDDAKQVILVRNRISGKIGVKKYVPMEMHPIYKYLKEHPSNFIPEIYELISYGDFLIVIEAYVEGKTIADLVAERLLDEQETAAIIENICDALMPLHEANPPIICRDITADNVMITGDGKPMLIDFNISRMVIPGKGQDTVLLGTHGYAAPEQFGFGQTDARTDIYAIGVLMNFMLTGKHVSEIIAQGKQGNIVKKCVEMNPNDRYASVRELKQVLKDDGTYGYEYQNFFPEENGYQFNDEGQGNEYIRFSSTQPQQKQKDIGTWRRFLPPGFRTGTVWKMLFSGAVYLFITWFFWTIEFTNEDGSPYTSLQTTACRLFLWVSEIATILIANNYLGIRDRLPIVSSKNIFIRVIGVIGYNIAILIVLLFIVVMTGIFG